MHINLLCACWHSEAVKGSSSLSSRRLLISLWVTSPLFLCPELTDAPCPYYGASVPPSPRWRPHSQGPHTLPFQGTRQVCMHIVQHSPICRTTRTSRGAQHFLWSTTTTACAQQHHSCAEHSMPSSILWRESQQYPPCSHNNTACSTTTGSGVVTANVKFGGSLLFISLWTQI